MPAATITAISRSRSVAAAPASPVASWNSGSAAGGAHLLEDGGAEQPMRVAQRLEQLGVTVIVADDKVDRLAGCLRRSRELARLTLELRRLICPVADNERGTQAVKMAYRAQALDHLVGELDVVGARRQPHRHEFVHAACAQPALDRIGRQPELAGARTWSGTHGPQCTG